jgi:hypothetical protein
MMFRIGVIWHMRSRITRLKMIGKPVRTEKQEKTSVPGHRGDSMAGTTMILEEPHGLDKHERSVLADAEMYDQRRITAQRIYIRRAGNR